ncbi:NAD(P)-dependent alcohol dehydrogenase [Sphingomonas sp. UYP23]
MLAYRMVHSQQPPELMEVPKPTAGPGQILVKVAACGLCHTDLGSVRNRTDAEWGDRKPPFTMGHEVAGWVSEIGDGVAGLAVGEAVAIVPIWGSCGKCPPCRRGEENFCLYLKKMMGCGIGFDGGLAEFMVVEARYAVPIGDFDPVLAAPLTDAGLTTYTAIKPVIPMLVPGASAVVIGVGGLGLLAVQLLTRLSGARVIAVDNDPRHLDLAKAHGADDIVISDAETAERIRDITAGAGAAFVLDCVGTETTMRTGIAGLARQGRLTLVGAARQTVPFGLHDIPWGAQLATSLNGGTTNLRELVNFARLGRIESIVDRYPLARVADAYDDLEHGRLTGRAVCLP